MQETLFINAEPYLNMYGKTPREFVEMLINEVYLQTGITATAGIGENLYLSKIAMDIEAKHIKPDAHGMRIAELTERDYREKMWRHTPLTDFWRIGKGYARKLEKNGMLTMGDIARCSLINEDLLYRLFGVNAELLIDHAWGEEPCTIADIKAYRPESSSISVGQVLPRPYLFDETKLIIHEMSDGLALDLTQKGLVTDQIILTVCYDPENLKNPEAKAGYRGKTETDRYGRETPASAHGSVNIPRPTALASVISEKAVHLFERIADDSLTCRRIYLIANHTGKPDETESVQTPEQLDFFTDYDAIEKQNREDAETETKAMKRQETIVGIKNKFGKNAIFKAMSLQDNATGLERNRQVGGHKA